MMTIEPRGEMEKLFANSYFTGQGRHSFRYSLVPHGGDWRSARIPQVADEQIHPCQSRHVYARAGADLPPEKSFVSASPSSIAASSWLYRDGGYEVRLHDTAGRSGRVRVELPMAATSCQSVDFNGRPMASPEIALGGSTASFQIGAWEIVTLRFEAES